ncbi:HNH endonuclease [bacterium]|nr:HNH endonuclease [bacterium]
MSIAESIHERLLAAITAMRNAESRAVTLFADVLKGKLYRELGFASIHLYAEEALGFSRSKTYEFIRLAEALDDLPKLKDQIESGNLPWTKAREVVKVATPETEQEWLVLAKNKSRRDLEKEVVKSRARRDANRQASQTELIEPECEVPAAATAQSLTLRLSPLAKARLEAMLEKLMKKHHCDRVRVLLMALESLLAESTRVDSSGSPYQVIVHKCPSCETKSTGQQRRGLSAAESAQIDCDSSLLEAGQRNKTSIPPTRRRAVLIRDGHRCQTKGCRSTSFLEVHHIKPRIRGGDNREANLITLCSSCHRHLHERGGLLAAMEIPIRAKAAGPHDSVGKRRWRW